MRILVGADVSKDPDSGAAGTVYHTNNALRELGHKVDEIWAPDLRRKIQHGNLHYLLELPRRYRDVVRERTKNRQYDVIQLSQPYAWLAAKTHQKTERSGVFVNRSHGLELMADSVIPMWYRRLGFRENSLPKSIFTKMLRWLLHQHTYRMAKYCDGILVPAQEIADYLVDQVGMPDEKIQVVWHGVVDFYIERPTKPMSNERQRRILYVGQYAFIKGPHILAHSLNVILAKYPDVTTTWICNQEHHNAVRDLLSPVATKRVQLIEWMPQEKLLEIYDSHGIFIFPSFYEGAAKACLEAMARGMCVVASEVGAIRDYITHQENGFLIPVGDVDTFVVTVDKLLASPELCEQISAKARTSVLQYTWRHCAEKSTEFYERLLTRKQVF